jgi:23S rRNA (cytosine1962-C5)-methyltransferase
MTDYPILTIRKNEERRLLAGHLWAFSNELVSVPKAIPSGTVVKLVREVTKQPFALAFYNPHSLIAARILTRNPDAEIDEAFFEQRIAEAIKRRATILRTRNAARFIHSESDFLPGLILDKFDDIYSFQINSAGFEARKEMLLELFVKLLHPKSIIEKNTSHSRTLEGLSETQGIVYGSEQVATIHDAGGVKYEIDVLSGQKTGFYLDQMENRQRASDYVQSGMRVLDLFTNEGGFGIHAARAGASRIVAVDSSNTALQHLRRNALLNGFGDQIEIVEADCFRYLADCSETFDLVVLDPPSLVKSKRELPVARKAYESLNANAMRVLEREGILVTASCSHHMSHEMFLSAIQEAARKARRFVSILEERGAAADHPILLGMPETEYLHLFILRVH